MNRDELLHLAHIAGFVVNFKDATIGVQAGMLVVDCTGEIERFAALVAANEREEAAKVCESSAPAIGNTNYGTACNECAEKIRKLK